MISFVTKYSTYTTVTSCKGEKYKNRAEKVFYYLYLNWPENANLLKIKRQRYSKMCSWMQDQEKFILTPRLNVTMANLCNDHKMVVVVVCCALYICYYRPA